MSIIKVKWEDGVTDNNAITDDVAIALSKYYPTWALPDIMSYLDNQEAEYVDMAQEAHTYEVIDIDTARKRADMSAYDAEDYEGMGDDDDMREAWIQDIMDNLTGHISTDLQGEDSEFLVLI